MEDLMRGIALTLTLFVTHLLSWPVIASAQVSERPNEARPNIVLMFPDNLGMGEVSSYGGARGVRTPSIDRLGQEGMRFTNFNAGPWRGCYNSAMEGGIRTPCVIRWPGRIPAGQVSNDVVHEVDLFPTIAAAAGAPEIVPHDRIIDGVNQLPFLEGKQAHSNRDSVLYVAREGHIMAVKWRDWKMWYHFWTEVPDPNPDNLVRLFDLRVDPGAEIDVKDFYPWVISIMDGIVADYEASLVVHPRVPSGIDDPYVPPPAGSGSRVATYVRTD
jgi:arylsulfatase A-like enzyme